MKKHFRDEVFTFQQDGAPSHTANKTQTWCEHHFPRFWRKELWPPSSPNLNPLRPLDFYVWSILEKEVCATAHTNIEALRKSPQREWAKTPQQTFRATVKSFRVSGQIPTGQIPTGHIPPDKYPPDNYPPCKIPPGHIPTSFFCFV